MVLLDDGAEISLFKDQSMVSSIVSCDSFTTINGAVGDVSDVTDKKGDFEIFKYIYLHLQALISCHLKKCERNIIPSMDVPITRTDLKNQKVIWGPHRAA